MNKISEQSVIDELKNGSVDILLYLTQRYFQSSRRWLRTKGVRDADTPHLFSAALVLMMREIQEKKPLAPLDIPKYLFSKISEGLSSYKAGNIPAVSSPGDTIEVLTSRCFSALDEDARGLLSAFYADNLSFEELAVRFGYSNPAIAEHEVNRQMRKLEGIVKAAMEV